MTTQVIWNKFEQRLYGFILQKVKDADQSKDILQDVFEKIHRKIDSLQSETKLESWLFSITRNSITDHFRKQKFTVEVEEHHAIEEENDRELVEKLLDCLIPFAHNLPSPYKEVLHDYQFRKIPQKTIAENRGVAYSTVRSQIKRARKMIHDHFLVCCKNQIEALDLDHSCVKNDAACCN